MALTPKPVFAAFPIVEGATEDKYVAVGANGQLVEVDAPSGSAAPVQDEGVEVVAAPTAINFTGAGVVVSDVGGVATVDISGAAVGAATSGALGTVKISGTPTDAGSPTVYVTEAADAALALKAPLASPALTGTPTAPTPTQGDNSTTLATTAYVDTAVAAGGGGGTAVGVHVERTAALDLANSSIAPVTWDTETQDDGGLWDAGSPTRFTIPSGQGGVYLIGGCVTFSTSTSGSRGVFILKNGTQWAGNRINASSGGARTVECSAVMVLAAGDYVEVAAHQTSGATMALDVSLPPRGWCVRLY